MLITILLGAGCNFDEGILETEIKGKLVVPKEAATLEYLDVNGEAATLTDAKNIGPVYLGAYSGLDEVSFGYPHPAMGPILSEDPGDAYPFGGTTVGRVDFACYTVTTCRVTTGRFADYDELLAYFRDVLGRPILDNHGNEVKTGEAFQQYCYDYWRITSDTEVSFIGALDFTENADGDFEADWSMLHTEFHAGMTLWGYMDKPTYDPSDTSSRGELSSCETEAGRLVELYGEDEYYEGRVFRDVLNLPSKYIGNGDWVASGVTIAAETDQPTILLDVPIVF